jgi:hypothetical protein
MIASSNFVGCSAGGSAGIVPRKRLAANRAVRSAKSSEDGRHLSPIIRNPLAAHAGAL